ncbi:MAG: glycerophosphoryl diester phosphodiesterase [Crocinitomicaceae bacterium]|jgi:glycerophosphoryl diester phosphodiesterase|nr:glycerophosphoryl diester phosphodiesterase [Crocinitomicaceae bacterium]
MKKSVFFGLFAVLLSCMKQEYEIENLNGGTIDKLGHGGMGVGDTYPMNTAESIKKCLSYDMDGTEMDVQMTKDGVLVAFHDEKLDSKTNLSGFVNDVTWAEIHAAKYIVTPHVQYDIIRLDELFASLDAKKYIFSFDVKLYSHGDYTAYFDSYKNALISLIESHTDPAKIMIESQDTVFLNMIKAEKPDYRLFYYPASFESGLESCVKHQYSGITISTRSVTKEQVGLAHQNGLLIVTWNTHSKKENREAILKNVDIIETDKVAYLSKALK